MIKPVPFEPDHLKQLAVHIQAGQDYGIEILQDPDYIELLMTGESYSFIHRGIVLMSCGVFPMTHYMGRAWALVSKHAGRELLSMTRQTKQHFINSEYIRIETPVNRDFENGHRWCKLIGFTNETPLNGMRHYGGDDRTYDLYAFFPKDYHVKAKPVQEEKT